MGINPHKQLDNDKSRRFFQRINESGNRLLELLNNLLDLSKLEAGKMQLDCAEHSCGELVDRIAEEFSALMTEKQLTLEYCLEDPQQSLWCDRTRAEQVIRNLLSNACKFSQPGAPVVIASAVHESLDSLEISVSDCGIGIPEEELEIVFDKFAQSSKTKNGAGGTGLGLAICREIVDAHGGTIKAMNNQFGGATFSVLLPLNKPLETSGESQAA